MKYIDIDLHSNIYADSIWSELFDFEERLHEYLEEEEIIITPPDTIQVNEDQFWNDILNIYVDRFNKSFREHNSCMTIVGSEISRSWISFTIAYDEDRILDEIGNLFKDNYNFIDAYEDYDNSSLTGIKLLISILINDYSYENSFTEYIEEEINELYIGNYVSY